MKTKDLSDSPLWNEYKQLSTAAENIVSNTLRMPAIAVAIVSAVAISGNVNVEYCGFGILIGITLLVIWLGYYHSILNSYGLQLVEIEQKINSRLPVTSPDRLTYYTDHMAEGNAIPGFNIGVLLIALVAILGYIASIWNVWVFLKSWKLSLFLRLTCVAVLLLPTVVALINIAVSEKKFHKKKQEVIEKFRTSNYPDTDRNYDSAGLLKNSDRPL
jgi:hypothetical protein